MEENGSIKIIDRRDFSQLFITTTVCPYKLGGGVVVGVNEQQQLCQSACKDAKHTAA